jgi:PAS domain S-box-containing protein
MDAAFVLEGVNIVYANRRATELLGYAFEELIGMDALEITSPRDQELVKTRTLARQRGEAPPHQYELSLVRKDGTEVLVETNASLIEYEGSPASLSFCRDMSERKTFEDKFYRIHQSVYKFGKARTPEEVYDIALGTIQHVLGFSFAGIAVIQDDVLIYEKTIGLPLRERWVIDVNSRSVTARTYRTGTTQIIPDISLDGDYLKPPTQVGEDCIFKSELTVPMNDNGETMGVINIESCEDNAFNQYDAKLIETLANHSAAALTRIIDTNMRTRYEDKKIKIVDENLLHAPHPQSTEN